jgi:hypothetical protein
MFNDLLLPIYLFAIYFALYCWSQSTTLAVAEPAKTANLTLVKTKPKSSRSKKSTIRSVIEQAAAAA